MPQSFASLYVHVVWSTKKRQPLLTAELRSALFAYWSTQLKNQKSLLLAAGGVSDHVHLLISFSREVSISKLVRELKAASSRWFHETGRASRQFSWQAGYGAFSVSHSQLAAVKKYIARQEKHHAKVSFQDEFRAFLRKHDIPFNEKYIWD